MLTTTLLAALLLQAVQASPAPSTACPMHAEHMAAASQSKATGQETGHSHDGVMARGEDARGMGFSQTATTHHFLLHRDGGEIRITAKDPADAATVSQIREHVEHIQAQFSAGDFSIPHFVHAQDPPGVDVMKNKRSAIRYRAENLKDGARLAITTRDRQALDALHEFLGFQIREHHTDDSGRRVE
jgi:hypothetical protein